MVLYSCNVCSYSTKLKANYARHNKSVKHLLMLNTTTIHNSFHHDTKSTRFDSQYSNNVVPTVNYPCLKIFACPYCDLEFNNRSNLHRHKIKSCKQKYDMIDLKQNKTIIDLKQQIINLNINIENIKAYSQTNMLDSESNEIIDSHNNSNNNNSNNNTNNTNNTNNSNNSVNSNNVNNNNIQQNIMVNNFGNGRDDWSHMTEKMIVELLKEPYSMISKAFKEVNLNKNVPQNQNIRITNRRIGKVLVWEDNMWKNRDKDGTMTTVVDEKYYELDGYFRNMMDNNPERLKELMTESEISAYNKFANEFDQENNEENVNNPNKQLKTNQFKEDCFCELVDVLDNVKYNGDFIK